MSLKDYINPKKILYIFLKNLACFLIGDKAKVREIKGCEK